MSCNSSLLSTVYNVYTEAGGAGGLSLGGGGPSEGGWPSEGVGRLLHIEQ